MNNKAFTKLEMIAVFTLAIFLSLLIVLGFEKSRVKSLDSKRLTDIFAFKKALDLYYLDNGHYPKGFNLKLGEEGAKCLDREGFKEKCEADIYMHYIPVSPGSDKYSYTYSSSSDMRDYVLFFYLQTDIGQYKAGQRALTPGGIK